MEWKLIEQTQELTDVIDLIKASSEVAVDLEADSLHHYHSKICLLQITAQGQHFLIDTLKIGDLSEVLSALQAKTILAHGCDYDLRMMKQHWNFVPSKIFDTMIASRLIGAKAFGLANLAKEYLNLELDKGSQKADWSRRPLPDNMQHYAAMDTAVLHELVSKIRHELDALGRMEWAEESCDWLLESATQAAPKERDRDSWRVKGSSNLIPKELAVLKCIWHFREELAQEWDQPVFKVLSNEKLIQMAEKATFFNEYNYQQLPKLPRNFKGSLTAKLLKGINEILSGPRETDPPRLKRKPPPVQSPHPLVLEKLREIRDSAAETLSLEPTLLANKLQLVSLSTHSLDTLETAQSMTRMMNWQYGLILPQIIGYKP